MNRRSFLQSAAILTFLNKSLPEAQAAIFERKTIGDSFVLEAHYNLSLHRVLHGNAPTYTPEFILADIQASGGRRFTNFSGDLSGRYVGALSSVAMQRKLDFPELHDLVIKIISEQHQEGFFGSSFDFNDPKDDDLALLWGNGRLLIGLLEYHQYRLGSAVLSAARRLGDFLVRVGPLMNTEVMSNRFSANHYATSYICWTQNIESLVALYRVTHDPAYLELARQITAHTQYRAGEHAHGFLTSLRGIGELYRVTGEAQYLANIESEWQRIAASKNMLPTGGVPERWAPLNTRTEGCAEADWIRLSLALWSATKQEKYLLAAERAIFNELLLNQFCEGDFGHRVLNDAGVNGTDAVRAWWCCSLHGLRCFPEIGRSAFRIEKGVIYYDLPVSGQSVDSRLEITAISTIENNCSVIMRVSKADGTSQFPIQIRKPIWAEVIDIKVNRSARRTQELDGYVTIMRKWKKNDEVEIRYGMRIQHELNKDDNRFSLFYGPWLLGIAKLDSESYFNEITTQNILQIDDSQLLNQSKISPPLVSGSPFVVPRSHFSVGYVPAEYPMQPGIVGLRAVSEQSKMTSTDWQFLFCKPSEENSAT